MPSFASAITILIAIQCIRDVSCQSNYSNLANNIEYQGEGLPEQTVLDGKVTKLDDLSPVIFLNRTKAALNCAAGSMQVELKFNEKFYGIAYADFDRNSACQVAGKGDISYKLELPLKGCGTKQDPQRVFTNNIVVRFHPGLEMDGDEVITIVCRYPPPVAPIPAALPSFIRDDLAPASIIEPPLKGFQILLIICTVMFLSLLLLGLGVSYYCLRRRPVAVVHRHPFSTGSGSEITKLSGSSLGNISMFENLKIPRAHAPVAATVSSSGSEGPLISDTLPSDYPSESHSEIEDVDTRSLPVSSAGSYENKAYVHDASSFYSEGYGHTQEQDVQNAIAAASMISRHPMPIKEQPKFDVHVRVKKAPPPPPSPLTSDAESAIMKNERNLSTIMEQREETIRSIESPVPNVKTQFTFVPDLHPPPKYIQQPPVYTKILRRQQELQESTMDIKVPPPLPEWDEPDLQRRASTRSMTSLNTEMTDTHSMTEIMDNTHNKYIAPSPPPPPPIVPITKQYQSTIVMEQSQPLPEPMTSYRQPEITSHVVDDVFLKTITEKRTIEDIERHKRLITEYHTKAKPQPIEPEQRWDVTIRNISAEVPDGPEWENFSDISSASNLTLTPKPERARMSVPPPSFVNDSNIHLYSPELVGHMSKHPTKTSHEPSMFPPRENYISTFNIPFENPEVPNWNVLIKVLKPVESEEGDNSEKAEPFVSFLDMNDKIKWRQIITTESTLRTLLSEAVIREDFERIRYDQRYEPLFEPAKWDIIIRILSSSERPKNNRYRKKSDWDTRSRRSSLPTLYEYDSDGGSSVRTLSNEPPVHSGVPARTRRSSRSSYRSEADLRSMSEVIVDFARLDHADSQSEASSYYPHRYYDDSELEVDYPLPRSSSQPSLVRSLSQPSLARSASEFTERWIAPTRYDTASEFTSPETTPKSQRSTKMQRVPGIIRYNDSRPSGRVSEQNAVWQSAASRQMTQNMPSGGAMSSQMMTQQYVSETTTSFQSRSQNWYGDNDSEASYK